MFVPTHLSVRGSIYSKGFFVRSILTDRYIHRTELWVVSLKSPFSVEYRIKKDFFEFGFPRSFRCSKFCEHNWFQLFLFPFSVFLLKFCQICLKLWKQRPMQLEPKNEQHPALILLLSFRKRYLIQLLAT